MDRSKLVRDIVVRGIVVRSIVVKSTVVKNIVIANNIVANKVVTNLVAKIHGIRAMLLVAALLPALTVAAPLTFGVVPQQSASRLAKQWGPIVAAMSEYVGEEIIFVTAPDIPTFEARLKQGEYSFAYMNPYHFTVYNKKPGYQALVRAKDKQINGIIVVRKDSNITELSQLSGHDLAFPSPAAFAASILTRSHLHDNGVDFNPVYVSSHDSVYLSVSRGIYPAGGGVMRTFNAMPEEIRQQLVPLWSTKGFTPHAIAANPNVDPKLSRQVQAYLLQMDSNPLDQPLLTPLKLKGFVAADNKDWDDVRALNIDLLSQD